MSLSFSKPTEKNVEMTSIILNVYIKYFGCQDTTSTLKMYYMQSYFDLLNTFTSNTPVKQSVV